MMASPVRFVVWLGVIAAAVAAGFYLKNAPTDPGVVTPPKQPGSYVFLAGGSDPYWELCVAGAKAAAAELDADLDVRIPKGEGEDGLREQLDWLGSIEFDGCDGVAIGPIDPVRETTLINSLAEKLTVVTVDSDAPQSRRMFYVGSSNYEAGMFAARMVKQALPDGGKVAVLLASLAKTNAAERKEGFEDELVGRDGDEVDQEGAAKYEVVDFYMDGGDYEKVKQNVRKACEDNPDLGVIVGTFGYHGPLALEALEEVEGGADIPLVAFDEDERTLAGVADGRIHATIVQDPFMFGSEAVRMLEQVRSGRFLSLPVAGRVDIGIHCIPVSKDNLGAFRTKLAERLGTTK